MSKVIWLRDAQQTTTVEWYITDEKKAIGVENMRDEWIATPIAPVDKRTGFGPTKDGR